MAFRRWDCWRHGLDSWAAWRAAKTRLAALEEDKR